jgi:hypothetical protein
VDSTLIGFIGVIAGAVTTGGVQAVLAYIGRRNTSLAASRMIYGALVEVDQALEAFTSWGHIPAAASFSRQIEMWEAQKEHLARVSDLVDYQILQAAFSNIGYIDDAIETAHQAGEGDGGLTRLRKDPSHSGRIETIRQAELIGLRSGRRFVDRLKSRSHLKRLTELPANESFLAELRSKPKRP